MLFKTLSVATFSFIAAEIHIHVVRVEERSQRMLRAVHYENCSLLEIEDQSELKSAIRLNEVNTHA